ncbi:MAG: hypothetical protein WAO52_18980 [Prolixibacteraceae bacterium]
MELSDEFKNKAYDTSKQICFGLFIDSIRKIIISTIESSSESLSEESDTTKLKKDMLANIGKEMVPVLATASAIKNCGFPKSLIFITDSGQAIDLLNVDAINQEDVFNQILDNVKPN